MATNFRIISERRNNQSLYMQLYGDFDGTSAHELVNFLDKCGGWYRKVAIDTEGLRTINDFGRNVFFRKAKRLKTTYSRITFTGRYESDFAQD
jgi:stage II sporulation protein AA (anti-sigma F factor antagonist)